MGSLGCRSGVDDAEQDIAGIKSPTMLGSVAVNRCGNFYAD